MKKYPAGEKQNFVGPTKELSLFGFAQKTIILVPNLKP